LLVKSAQQMVTTAQDLQTAGVNVPILVGGAALTRKFTKNRIAPEYDGLVLYARDAMDGLDIANKLMNSTEREKLINEMVEYKNKQLEIMETQIDPSPDSTLSIPKSNVSREHIVVEPRDTDRHVLRDYPISHLLPYVNMQMLLGHHLGLTGKVEKRLEENDPKAIQLKSMVDEIFSNALQLNSMRASGTYRFFPAQSQGNDVVIYDPTDRKRILKQFTFPRQNVPPYLCLADYLKSVESGIMDYVGLMIVTTGYGIRKQAEEYKEAGEYLRSHAIQAVALEMAEAFAERMHQMMRDIWGIPDPANMTIAELFGAKYRGQRFSFGYPACPNLEDQALLFDLLQPQDIGIELTDSFMMEPEASVSAIVFAHPEARYFNVDKAE